ncbi:hypothetical protein CRENBAI_017639 [Crenichthys baileyi]|uniref:Uncharacterized protein n=1 Tax=Crenichthys baileyi TaxID=28760 RepID=A0AAV9RRC4_9TELE
MVCTGIGLLSYVDSGVDFQRFSVHEAHHANQTEKQFLSKCDRVKLHPLTWKQQVFSLIWILMGNCTPLFGLFLHVLLGYKPSLVSILLIPWRKPLPQVLQEKGFTCVDHCVVPKR